MTCCTRNASWRAIRTLSEGRIFSWVGDTIFRKWTNGYGYHPLWVVVWVVFVTVAGWIWLWRTGQNQAKKKDGTPETIGFWYSLDMLLPIIELRKAHYEIDLEGSARYYFYVHKIMGYVLASYLIVALAGVTK